jgi:2-keto-4-pentenoate hydratase/2-oxohepta-3-ene-1,7-dioic acid hydratase in catechol pathway
MKLVTYSRGDGRKRLGVAKGGWKEWDCVIDLNIASKDELPSDILSFIDLCGEPDSRTLELAREVVKSTHFGFKMSEVRIHPPIVPRLLRDTIAFRGHISMARGARGGDVPKEWNKLPAYYIGNHLNIMGTGDDINVRKFLLYEDGKPLRETCKLDYEAELAFVLAKGGINISREGARDYLFGVTIFNDFSMRDLQLTAMAVGMGPAAGKDFANALGPCIVTADEFNHLEDKRITVRVNAEERLNGTYRELVYYSDPALKGEERLAWTFEEIVEFISHSQRIYPGEVWGSGTIPGGCELEKGEAARYLKRGDVVEIEVEGIGVLRNKIV